MNWEETAADYWKERAEKAEAELAEARRLYAEEAGELRRALGELAEARKDSKRLDYWLSSNYCFDNREHIDDAMKGEK